MKNLVLNLRNAKAQAGCAESKHTSLSFRKGLGVGLTCLLLTLGVGQMWADTWTVAADNTAIINGSSTWSPSTSSNDLTNVSGNTWALLVRGKSLSKTTYYFKICKNHAWSEAYPGSNYGLTVSAAGTYDILYTFDASSHDISVDLVKSWTVAGTEAALGSDWSVTDNNNKMTWNSGFTYRLTKSSRSLEGSSCATYECKVCKDQAWGTSYPASNKTFTVSQNGTYNITFDFNVVTHDVSVSTSSVSLATDYFIFGTGGNGLSWTKCEGIAMSGPETDYAGNTYYYFQATGARTFKIVELYNDWDHSTYERNNTNIDNHIMRTDIDLSNSSGNVSMPSAGYIIYYPSSDKICAVSSTNLSILGKPYDITYLDQGGGAFSGSHASGYPTTHSYGTATALKSASKTGYTFGGWFTNSACTGSSTSSLGATAYEDDITLYAQWTEKTYSLTFSCTNGTIKVDGANVSSGSTASVNHFTTKTLVATPSSGYRFTGWTLSGSNTSYVTIADASAASTTIKATKTGATVTANFEALPSGQLDIVAGANGQVKKQGGSWGSSASYTDVNDDSDLNIYAQANTGYHFVNWTKSGDGSIKTNAASGVYTLPGRGSATVTANFAETKHDVTVQYKCGSTTIKTATTASNVGEVTTSNVSAPVISGYNFSNWTVESGVTATTSTTSSPITIKTKSSGTYTITANYDEDLTTPYVIKGGTAITGSNWTVDIPFTKKSGESTGTVAYAEIPISATVVTDVANTNYNLKVYNNSNSHWVGLNEGSGDWWYYSNSGEKTLTDNAGNNIQLRANVVGTYIVKLDYTTASSPKITITWPVALSIYRSDPNDATNVGDHAWNTMPTSTSYRWTLNLEANTTYEFKINEKGTYYGSNTDITTTVSNRAFSTGTSDTKLITKSAGTFTFTWDASTHKLTLQYPKSTAMGASPISVYSGGTTTLTAYGSELGSGTKSITYDFYKGTTLTDANKVGTVTHSSVSGTDDNTTQNVTVNFDGNNTSQVYTIKMTIGGNSWTNTVTVYRKWDIYVHDVDSWNAMYYYVYDNTSGDHREDWPGLNYSSNKITGSTTWYIVTLDAQYPHFILNNNAGNKQTWGNGVYENDITDFASGSYWYVEYKETTAGKRYYDLHSIEVTDPTVTLSASVANCKDITLTGTVTDCGGDGMFASDMKEVYFQVGGTKNAATSVSTSSGAFTKTLSNATAGATNTLQAFATNIHGLGSSSILHYTNVTLNRQGGTTGTTAVTAVENTAMPAGATKPGKTGYIFGGYYASAGGSGKQYYNASMGSANNWDLTSQAATIHAKWTAITYTIHFNGNGNTSGSMSDQTGVTYDSGTTLTANAFEKTGYNFAGWATTKERADAGTVDRTDGAAHGNLTSTQGATAQLWAVWTPKQSAISFDYQLSTEGHGNAGTLSSVTATYDAAMPALTGNMPTAAEGYAFMGFFSETGGNGTKYYNADKSSAHNWDVDTESGTTLYAYYKKAEITGITFSPAAAEPGDEVTATAAISPTPSGTTTVCWEVRYASNDIPLSPQPTLTPASGASVTFTAPPAAVYKFVATLKTGNDCAAGTVLDTEDANLTVAGNHAVTIRYKHGDVVIKEETVENIHAVNPTPLSAPDIIGYAFSSWTLGDGISLVSGTTSSSSISVTAIYDGVITINYNPKRMIYFYNSLGWSSVNVYFYKNDSYWNNTNGTGADQTYTFTNIPYSEGKHGAMTNITGTNIWYFDAEGAGVNASYDDVVFTELDQHGYGYFAKTDDKQNKVVRRGDYKSSMPMFVPVEQDGVSMNGGRAIYYNEGYWMNYPENTGYTVRIYNAWNADNASPAREYYFPYSSDKKMPLKLDVEFNTTDAKWFSIYRNDGVYLGVNAEMTQASHTNYRIKSSNDKIKIQPSATGVYTYTLTFYDDGEKDGSGKAYGNMYHITVDYPVSVGDYRILYKDNATWSQGTAHTASWCHPSDAVNKISAGATEAKKDTVSLFVSYGASPTAKFQYVSAINASTGAVTWSDVAGGTISLSSITKSGTYNFIVTQPVGGASVSVEKIEAYTGNYYIRTDCAGNTKWDNYRAADHQMTYSEFSCSEANSFGEKFSHYFTHWCPAGMNVKFVIANDYSSCISDTLIQDVGNTYANINSDGFLNSDGSTEETANRFSANIRFMYHETTNKISRAYVASSTNEARWFLVLRSNSAIHGQDDDPIEDIGSGKPSVILEDQQNWIYEQTLKIKPGSKFKLFACYADVTPTEERAQYFRGNYASNDWSNSANTIELVGGTGDYQKVRVLYDFKTNRLVCAWLPDGDVSGDMDINADVMIIREHQEDATLITFATSSSKLTDVKTVYGTMKFNRWTLNNKSSADGHAVLPLESQKSIFERALYFISFPFDVNLGEVFGFGTYGVHWIIENYDGENRAKNGYWTDSPPNWKYVMSPKGYTLKANKGYILCLDLDQMKDDNEEFWPHGINTVELFFPSAVSQKTIEQDNVTIPAPDPAVYQCTINRPGKDGDRRVKDSYWRCLGVPSFANYTTTLSNGTSTITWQTADNTLPYLYVWNMEDNTLSAQSTSTFAFKTMHAYLTQCATAIVWSAASKPTPIAARYSDNEMLKDREFRLELAENDVVADQTYVRLSAREDVTASFEFGNDMSKEMNTGKSNIYTFIGTDQAAANSLPLSTEQTTIIPVGVLANTAGDYTFSIPDGTDGIGITLVDNENGIRTQLGALDYTVTLDKGTYDERFYLEISPIHNTPTGMENGGSIKGENGVRKVIIDQNMYIIRDGKMYDARGARVE